MKSNVTFKNYFKHKLTEMSIAELISYIELQLKVEHIKIGRDFDRGARFAKEQLVTPISILKHKLTEGK